MEISKIIQIFKLNPSVGFKLLLLIVLGLIYRVAPIIALIYITVYILK